MLPDKTSKCHRAGFQETCFKCVTEHGCKLWKRVTLIDRHPETGAEISRDAYDCLDSQQELFWKDMLRRQLQTTATVDKVAATVQQGNENGAILGMNHLRAQLQAEGLALAPPRSAPLMIETD